MQTGKLDQRVTLYSRTVENESGEVVESYTLVATVWASVKPKSFKNAEIFEGAQAEAKESILILVRWRDDVTTEWRMVWRDQTYNITQVDRSQRRKGELYLTADLENAE